MKKIEPINWKILNTQMTGRNLEDAMVAVSKILVDKVNEMVEEFNSK